MGESEAHPCRLCLHNHDYENSVIDYNLNPWQESVQSATDAFVGLLAFSLQVSALAIYSNWVPDDVASGIWGGIYLVAFAALLFSKRLKSSQIVMSMAVFASLIGATIIGLYSWSIDGYQELIADCELFSSGNFTVNSTLYPDIFSPLKICDRAAIDSLMIICGILAFIVNGFIAATASSITS
ncbi:hypothetical protein GHT06_013890 [Daphnia sinensis]|uniref:Uncharacterized protein n=1 Tax=Daphnia sinensis TaxID=1820382 RepID=A0AAD5LCU0_9CRUS|nr:hypothetical protein GHT06_013890 [Daphnia sinensis]